MYRPLPDGLTIKNSPIEGLGLFTTINIKNTNGNAGNKKYEDKLKVITLAYTQLKNTYREKN